MWNTSTHWLSLWRWSPLAIKLIAAVSVSRRQCVPNSMQEQALDTNDAVFPPSHEVEGKATSYSIPVQKKPHFMFWGANMDLIRESLWSPQISEQQRQPCTNHLTVVGDSGRRCAAFNFVHFRTSIWMGIASIYPSTVRCWAPREAPGGHALGLCCLTPPAGNWSGQVNWIQVSQLNQHSRMKSLMLTPCRWHASGLCPTKAGGNTEEGERQWVMLLLLTPLKKTLSFCLIEIWGWKLC